MSERNLKDVIKEASEIAGVVPKHLQEAAFHRAVDLLTKPSHDHGSSDGSRNRRKIKPKQSASTDTSNDSVAILLSDLDRTSHKEIFNAPRTFERSLFLLRAARDDHDIDGLTAPQIATVLTKKFRLATTRQAVYGALNSDSAKRLVDARSTGGSSAYHLMYPGDQYLDAGDFDQTNSGSSARNKKKRNSVKKKVAKKRAASPTGQATAKTTVTNKTKKKTSRSGRPGPGNMLTQLTNEGYFSTPRSIKDIQQHCEGILAHTYTLQDLSTPLRRAVHSKLLERVKNDEGQYEYSAS